MTLCCLFTRKPRNSQRDSVNCEVPLGDLPTHSDESQQKVPCSTEVMNDGNDFRRRCASEPSEHAQKKRHEFLAKSLSNASSAGSDAGYAGSIQGSLSLPRGTVAAQMLENIPEESTQLLGAGCTSTDTLNSNSTGTSYRTAQTSSNMEQSRRSEPTLERENEKLRRDYENLQIETEELRREDRIAMEVLRKENEELREKIEGFESRSDLAMFSTKDGILISCNKHEGELPRNCAVGKEVVLSLAKRLPKWKFLARHLRLEDHDIQQIIEDNPNDVREQSYQMLMKWKQTQEEDSYHTLGEAIRRALGESVHLEYVKLVNDEERLG